MHQGPDQLACYHHRGSHPLLSSVCCLDFPAGEEYLDLPLFHLAPVPSRFPHHAACAAVSLPRYNTVLCS